MMSVFRLSMNGWVAPVKLGLKMEIMDCICAVPRVSTRHLCSEYVCDPLFALAMKTAAS